MELFRFQFVMARDGSGMHIKARVRGNTYCLAAMPSLSGDTLALQGWESVCMVREEEGARVEAEVVGASKSTFLLK